MGYDKKYLLFALTYAAIGMGLGIYMGMSQDHGQFVTHAHILLVGFAVSFIYGVIHKLWLESASAGMSMAQMLVHQISAVVMLAGLFLMFGKIVPEETAGPILGIASIGVLIGMLLMIAMVLRATAANSASSV
ncbi:MAG TPA: hypothetical protein VIF60_19655 [Burkholderiaceae bacterium]|jgi:hypothetical protein